MNYSINIFCIILFWKYLTYYVTLSLRGILNESCIILATIYCPNGNPNARPFETINNLSDNVMFVGDFNSEAFGCAKKNISGLILENIQSHLNLTYLNNDE